MIYNGVDAHQSEISRGKDLTIDQRNTNIVMVSRYHPIKDYNRFFSIVSEVLKVEPSIKFYLIGMDNTAENPDLVNDLRQYGLSEKISLLDEVDNVSHILHKFNLLVSTSKSESFALTVLEAILSGTNVSTIDLPVMNELFGDFSPNTGELKDSEIARKWIQKAKCPPSDELIEIAKNFSIEIMVSRYQDLYSQVAPSKNNAV